jgi:hypothetical protein
MTLSGSGLTSPSASLKPLTAGGQGWKRCLKQEHVKFEWIRYRDTMGGQLFEEKLKSLLDVWMLSMTLRMEHCSSRSTFASFFTMFTIGI